MKMMQLFQTRIGLVLIIVVAAAVGILVFTKNQADENAANAPGELVAPSIQQTPVQPRVDAPVQREMPLTDLTDSKAGTSPQPVPFRVGAIIDRGNDELSAGLVSDVNGNNAMVRVGDSFEGYRVVSIDPSANRVYLSRGGQQYVAGMTAGTAIGTVNASQVAPQMAVITDDTTMTPDGVRYEATEDERNRGIDPNDAETWPSDYRGPGIERAGIPENRYDATPDEVKRGIDPNNAETWPSDYRGPGIERAMLQMQQQKQQQ